MPLHAMKEPRQIIVFRFPRADVSEGTPGPALLSWHQSTGPQAGIAGCFVAWPFGSGGVMGRPYQRRFLRSAAVRRPKPCLLRRGLPPEASEGSPLPVRGGHRVNRAPAFRLPRPAA